MQTLIRDGISSSYVRSKHRVNDSIERSFLLLARPTTGQQRTILDTVAQLTGAPAFAWKLAWMVDEMPEIFQNVVEVRP